MNTDTNNANDVWVASFQDEGTWLHYSEDRGAVREDGWADFASADVIGHFERSNLEASEDMAKAYARRVLRNNWVDEVYASDPTAREQVIRINESKWVVDQYSSDDKRVLWLTENGELEEGEVLGVLVLQKLPRLDDALGDLY